MSDSGANVRWIIHNGHKAIATFEFPASQDSSSGNTLAFYFNQLDKMFGHKLKYLCISPETLPNPEAFKHDE